MDASNARATSTLQPSRSVWRRGQWTVCFVAVAVVSHIHAQDSKPAEPTVVAANRAVRAQLPFSDRQDFEDATRGFIATSDDASGPNRYAFLNGDAPSTVNPSLWRQAQLNVPNGLFTTRSPCQLSCTGSH